MAVVDTFVTPSYIFGVIAFLQTVFSFCWVWQKCKKRSKNCAVIKYFWVNSCSKMCFFFVLCVLNQTLFLGRMVSRNNIWMLFQSREKMPKFAVEARWFCSNREIHGYHVTWQSRSSYVVCLRFISYRRTVLVERSTEVVAVEKVATWSAYAMRHAMCCSQCLHFDVYCDWP